MSDDDKEVMAALQRAFGYQPNERDGEKWVVYRDHTLIVCHPERRPRLFERGCAGRYTEIEPILR